MEQTNTRSEPQASITLYYTAYRTWFFKRIVGEDLSGPSFGHLTCEKAKLFPKKLSFFAGLAIVTSFGQNVKKLSFLQKA